MIGELETRYELSTRVGGGPTGIVWHAWSLVTGETVAIKALHPHLAADSQIAERFAKERAILTTFVHPALARVHEVHLEEGVIALVRELVPGTAQGTRPDQDPPISARHAVIVAAQIAEALAVAHRSGVVHGGLKPTNLIVSRAQARLTDCRITPLVAADPAAAHAAGRDYMAPECVSGAPPGPAADVYALGCVLRDTLALRPRVETPDLPRALQDLIAACLETDPQARPGTLAVAGWLRSIRDEHSLSAVGSPPPRAGSDLDLQGASHGDVPDDHAGPAADPAAGLAAGASTFAPASAPAQGAPDGSDEGAGRERAGHRSAADPAEPVPDPRPGSGASHVRRKRKRHELRRGQRVMVGVVSAALLGACVVAVIARNSTQGGNDHALPRQAGQATDRSQAQDPVSPRAALSSAAVPGSGAADQSSAAATRFVFDWFGALNRAVSSGDTAQLDAMSAAGCSACARARQVVREAYRDGGTLRGGLYEVRSAKPDSFWGPSHRVVHVVFDRSPRVSVSAGGTERFRLASATFATCQLVLDWKPHGWQVREVLATAPIT